MNKQRFIRIFRSIAGKYIPQSAIVNRISQKCGVIFLMYHSVSDSIYDFPYAIENKYFEIQMRYLTDNYEIISIDKAFQYLRGEISLKDKPYFVITFDDGFMDNYITVYPLLQKCQIPAAIFLTTNFIDAKSHTHMSWNEVCEISKDLLMSIGAHTASHLHLGSITKEDIYKEVVESKMKIENKIGQDVKYFSYPFGGAPAHVINIVKQNYDGALKDRYNLNSWGLHTLPRLSVEQNNKDLRNFLFSVSMCRFLRPVIR